jgi:hypothetical protein
MPHFPARIARLLLVLLVLGAPVAATLAFETAASGRELRQKSTDCGACPAPETIKAIEATK